MTRLALLLATITLMASCDSGDIEPTSANIKSSGRTVKLTATFSGVGVWAERSCNVVLAGFTSESTYAQTQAAVPSTLADGTTRSIVLSSIPQSTETVELAITNNLRTRVITLHSVDMSAYESYGPTDTIFMDLGEVDVSLFGAIQTGVFDQACIACHGGNGSAAGNTNLTQGMAEAQLVGVSSTQLEGYTRVVAGDAEGSLLWMILNEGGENLLHYNHTEVLSSQFKDNLAYVKQLISDWIASLR